MKEVGRVAVSQESQEEDDFKGKPMPHTLSPANIAPIGGYLEDQFAPEGTLCEVPC